MLCKLIKGSVSIYRIMSKKCKLDVNHLGSVNSNVLQTSSISAGSAVNMQNKRGTNITSVDSEGILQLPSPTKPDSDKKEYTTIQLANGLKVLLISDVANLVSLEGYDSDATTDDEESQTESSEVSSEAEDSETEVDTPIVRSKGKGADEKLAACSLTVGVGSFSDPQDIQGLAHFLEHMLFMGSEKYPKENEFDAYIKRKGGSDNASTECEYTTYYFECQEKYLLTGMDMFAHFFISPLLKKEAMTREREAIESEFQMALPSDSYRREQLICSLAKDTNPAKKFTWGNLSTLRDSVHDDRLHEAVKDFWKVHYSAHRMTLAIQARLPTNTLKNWVVQCFSNIPNNRLPAPEFPTLIEPFDRELFNKFYRAEAVQEMYVLEVNWALPPVIKLYKSKPLSYLSWLIGHEGAGSLTAYLRQNLWASGLTSGHSDDGLSYNSIYTLFSITAVLSDKGRENIRSVLKAIFSYVKMLQREGPNERVFREVQAIDQMQFRFSEEESAVDNVETLSENMQFYPPEDYITGSELSYEYKPDEIKLFLDMMTPSNANIILNAHNSDDSVVYDKVEPWFKTRYTYEDIADDLREELNTINPYPDFHLPKPNEFIATDFTLLPERSSVMKYPEKCLSRGLIDVYCKPDMKFRLPIGYVGLNIITPMPEQTARNSALLLLYIRMLQFTLVEETYPANMALLEDSISPCERGFNISVYGFSHKLHLLLQRVAKGIQDFNQNVTEELFETYKKMTQRGLTNMNLKAGSLARDVRMSLLLKKYWTSAAKYHAISNITLEDVKKFAEKLFKGVHIQCLVQGNFDEDQAQTICTNFVEALDCTPLEEKDWPKILVYQLPLGEKCCRVNSFNYEDKNCITSNYFQYGPASIKEYCLVEMLLMLMEEPLFDKLRTQEQLGYDVSCTVRDTFGILGFSIAVNSQIDKHSVSHVENRITDFLHNFVTTLQDMPQEEYNEALQSLIKIKQCSDIHLKEEVKRNWGEINSCEYAFDRLEREVQHISNITKDEVIHFLHNCVSEAGKKFRKLSVQVVGHNAVPGTFNKRDADNKLNYEFLTPSGENKIEHYFINDFTSFQKDLTLYPPSKII